MTLNTISQSTQTPHCYDIQKNMHVAAKTMICAAFVLALITILGALFSHYYLTSKISMIAISTVGGGLVLISIPFAIFLLKKSYWNDPAYKNTQSQCVYTHLQEEGYVEMKNQFGSLRDDYDLLPNESIREFVLQEGYANLTTLKQLEQNVLYPSTLLIQDNVLSKEDLSQLLLTRNNPESVHSFLTTHGVRPFSEGLITKDSVFNNGKSLSDLFTEALLVD